MTIPPRFVESVLGALGATPEYRDLVIGDLAEEFAMRVGYDGEEAARTWYHREAIRSIPHLIGNGIRAMRGRDLTRVTGIVATAWVLVTMTVGIGFTLLHSSVIQFWPNHRWIGESGSVTLGLAVTISASAAFAGGYTAAWLDRRTPLVSAAALRTTWALAEIVLLLLLDRVGPAPTLFPVVVPSMLLVSTIVGGLSRVRSLTERLPIL